MAEYRLTVPIHANVFPVTYELKSQLTTQAYVEAVAPFTFHLFSEYVHFQYMLSTTLPTLFFKTVLLYSSFNSQMSMSYEKHACHISAHAGFELLQSTLNLMPHILNI